MSKTVSSVATNGKKKKMGRPKSALTAVVRLPVSMLQEIDGWCRQQNPSLSRSKAIRQILGSYLKMLGLT